MNKELQARTKADSSTTDAQLPSANLAQNPVLAAVLIQRKHPCLCCACPTCGAVFMATALNNRYHADDDANRDLLSDITDYATQGYLILAKDASEFRLDYCEHLKANKV